MFTGILGDDQLGAFTLGGVDAPAVESIGPSQMTATVTHPARLTATHTASNSSMTIAIT